MAKLKSKASAVGLPVLIHDPKLIELHRPPDDFEWHQSTIKDFRSCKRRFYWKHVCRLTPKAKAVPLIIGSAFHAGLAVWYTQRVKMTHYVENYLGKLEEEAKRSKDFYGEEDFDKLMGGLWCLRGMLTGYAEVYASDRTDWPKSARRSEIHVVVKLPGGFKVGGTLDLLVMLKSPLLVEHKTLSRMSSSYIDRIRLDTQVRTYMLLARRGLNVQAKKVLYNVARKSNKRRKSGESLRDFTDRIAEDYIAQPSYYFYREELIFDASDLIALEHQFAQTHLELLQITQAPNDGWKCPHAWTPNDFACDARGTCPYYMLCVNGLDRGTFRFYQVLPPEDEEEADD